MAVTADTLRWRNLVRDIVEVSRRGVRPGPLDAPPLGSLTAPAGACRYPRPHRAVKFTKFLTKIDNEVPKQLAAGT